jgi:predicted DNA-binding transcriptional regulator YafY
MSTVAFSLTLLELDGDTELRRIQYGETNVDSSENLSFRVAEMIGTFIESDKSVIETSAEEKPSDPTDHLGGITATFKDHSVSEYIDRNTDKGYDFIIVYFDQDGKESIRKVSLKFDGVRMTDDHMVAYCQSRLEYRHFKFDSISQIFRV